MNEAMELRKRPCCLEMFELTVAAGGRPVRGWRQRGERTWR